MFSYLEISYNLKKRRRKIIKKIKPAKSIGADDFKTFERVP